MEDPCQDVGVNTSSSEAPIRCILVLCTIHVKEIPEKIGVADPGGVLTTPPNTPERHPRGQETESKPKIHYFGSMPKVVAQREKRRSDMRSVE